MILRKGENTMSQEFKEIEEAILAGNRALQALEAVEMSLNSARNWGVWDLLGGGFISGMMKHSRLDEAQSKMDYAVKQIQHFNKEIGEVQSFEGIQMNFDGLIKGIDYFLDSFMVDFMVQREVKQRQEQIIALKSKVKDAIYKLQEVKNNNR